jgi:hypothetical protein
MFTLSRFLLQLAARYPNLRQLLLSPALVKLASLTTPKSSPQPAQRRRPRQLELDL